MALPKPITQPGRPDPITYAERSAQGQYITTNRDNQGAWASYLDAIRRVPGSGLSKNNYVTPEDRANRQANRPPMSKPIGAKGSPTRGQLQARQTKTASPAGKRRDINIGAIPAGRYNAAQESRAGTPEANYAAGIRRYGAGMRSAPNVGAVRNKGGYNERDRRLAAQREANLATGDALSRVRTMGG